MKKILYFLLFVFLYVACAPKSSAAWVNDLRSVFQANGTVIYAVNIRTFNAKDLNNNGIIEEDLGEERGSFINAIERLDELASTGVNTILLLPVTPVGKVKALGTAGSLYAASSFNEINPQLKSKDITSSVENEMRKFVEECHNRKIRVIVDLPSCGAYDLFLTKPELFVKDANQKPIIPADWTDVRLLDAGTEAKINTDVYNLYQEFIDLMINLDVDGIRASVAYIKPANFWKKIIDETRLRNPQFLFLAEASKSWNKSPSDYAPFTSYDKLLDAGFDGYYGKYSDLKNWKYAKDLYASVREDIAISKKYSGNKKVLGNFSTHDEISPMLINGPQYAKMIVWLNSTLPVNSYNVDGFTTGDTYLYPWANKRAAKTFTDDEYYFVHRGQLDIFNFSRKPMGKNFDIYKDFIMANRFKFFVKDVVNKGNFVAFKTTSPSVFAYARSYNNLSVVVVGNLDFKNGQKVKVFIPKINTSTFSVPVKVDNLPKLSSGKLETQLNPGEIMVLYFDKLDLK